MLHHIYSHADVLRQQTYILIINILDLNRIFFFLPLLALELNANNLLCSSKRWTQYMYDVPLFNAAWTLLRRFITHTNFYQLTLNSVQPAWLIVIWPIISWQKSHPDFFWLPQRSRQDQMTSLHGGIRIGLTYVKHSWSAGLICVRKKWQCRRWLLRICNH